MVVRCSKRIKLDQPEFRTQPKTAVKPTRTLFQIVCNLRAIKEYASCCWLLVYDNNSQWTVKPPIKSPK